MADMTNAIANFGMQAGQNIRNTVGNALARNEDNRRYQNQLAMLKDERDLAATSARDKAEREYGKGWSTAYFSAPEDKRPLILQGGIQKAVQKGFLKPEEAQAVGDEYMYRLAAETGVDFSGGSNLPSDVQSTQWLMNQPEDVRALHLKNKRGDQVLNLGGTQLVRTPGGQVSAEYQVTPKPQDMPGFKASVAGAQEGAKQEQKLRYGPEIAGATEMAKGQAKKAIVAPKLKAAYESAKAKTNRVSGVIDSAINRVNGWTAGAGGTLLSKFPGTAAADLEADMKTIKANLGFSELQQMRDNSPTGGALGSITERELGFLQSVVANIEQSQSPEQLRRNLDRAKTEVKGMWERVDAAYRQEYGGAGNNSWSIKKKAQ